MPPESFRFVAYVGDKHGYCTGAIIAPTWVLTAAHCVVKGDGSTIRPDEIGDLSRGWPDDDWERVPVKRVISHPHYYWQGDGFRNDVALLETVRPFASSDIVPVEVLGLEEEAFHAANGVTGIMVGYGEDESGQRDRDGLFRVVRAPLHHADACRTQHSFVDSRGEIVHEGTICAGDRTRGIRGGDSGSPLLVETDDGAYGLVGIASISGHDPSGHPVVAVYTRVATVKDWIDGCVLGTGECVEGGVKPRELKRNAPDEVRESETLEPRSTAIIFVNETEEIVSYHWIDFNGNERYYGSVGPRESVSQHTFPGHVWAVKDGGGRALAIFVAERETGRAIVSADALMAIDDDSSDRQDARVVADTDSAWVLIDFLEFDYEGPTDHFTSFLPYATGMDLDEERTPGTWGGYPNGTRNRPPTSKYDGAWAVYRAADGAVVQVAVYGHEADPDPGASWRVLRPSGWDRWQEGRPGGIETEHRLPRQKDLSAAPIGPVTIVQPSQLAVRQSLLQQSAMVQTGGTHAQWLSSWALMITEATTGIQAAVECWAHVCQAWQRASELAIAAVDTDVSDDEAIDREADSAWIRVEQEFPCPDPCVGWWRDGAYWTEYDPSVDLDEQITPGTWGGYPQGTRNRPSPYDGVWSVYRAADGAVVQVAVWGSESDPPESGAGWRVQTGSGWDDWNIGTGPFRIEIGSRLPRYMDLQADPVNPATIVQASQLNVPVPRETGRDWLSSWLLLIHDEAAGAQTVLQCWYGCRGWQRTPPSTVAVERETSVHDDEAIETETDTRPDFSRDRIARVLDEALAATTWNMHGNEVPDWTTRLRALELVIEIFRAPVEIDDGPALWTPPSTVEDGPSDSERTSIPEQGIDIPEPVSPPPAVRNAFSLDSFYQQWVDVRGLPVIASARVNPYAVKEAAWLIKQMLGHRPDLLRALAQNGVRFVVMAHDEMTTDIPEHSDLTPADYWDRRARGLGPTPARPATSAGEENLLNYPSDPYHAESILIHEFSHAIHTMGLNVLDPEFDDKLARAFDQAARTGKWKNTYAITDKEEYWAEGAQSWFDANREHDSEHNHVNTREEIKEYDPSLAALLADVYGDGDWRYTPATARTNLPFLRGLDPARLPRFEWPSELIELPEVRPELRQPDGVGMELNRYDPDVAPDLKSMRNRVETAIVFVNDTGGEISWHWIDFDGRERPYGTVGPGGEAAQHTFQGHVWVAKDAEGNPLALFLAEDGAGRARVCRDCPFDPMERGTVVRRAGSWFEGLCRHIGSGNLAEVDRLVGEGADVNARSGDDTAVYCARQPRVLRNLVEEHGADPNGGVRDGEHLDTPLCKAKTLEMAQELVRLGAVVRGRGDNSQSLLQCAAYYGRNIEHFDYLIDELGADVNEVTPSGTALCMAAAYQRTEVVAALLDRRADPNLTDRAGGQHPLECASRNRSARAIIDMLEAAGAVMSE